MRARPGRFFRLSLAREFQEANIDLFLSGITAKDEAEWRAYFKIERELIENAGKPKQSLKDKIRAGLRGKADGGLGKVARKRVDG